MIPTTGALVEWVTHVWSPAWSEPVPASESALINHPTIHLTVEAGPPGEVRHGHPLPAAAVHGVPLRRFALDLPASGWVVGMHMTPGAVADLTGTPA